MKKLIMSDLDNTLLPVITQEKFADIWFRDIAEEFKKYGLDAASGLYAMRDGCRAMFSNTGAMKNREAFYEVACRRSGIGREQIERVADRYYSGAFINVKKITRSNPFAPEIVRLMKEHAKYTAIATMPIFPLTACDMRMRWVGISADRFDLVTSWDKSSYCKPDLRYYLEIMERFGVTADETLMIGNDVREDMEPCEKLGIDTFLITDYVLDHDLDYTRFRQGSYPELIEYLKTVLV